MDDKYFPSWMPEAAMRIPSGIREIRREQLRREAAGEWPYGQTRGSSGED